MNVAVAILEEEALNIPSLVEKDGAKSVVASNMQTNKGVGLVNSYFEDVVHVCKNGIDVAATWRSDKAIVDEDG